MEVSNSDETYFVTDTSVLIGALPFIRAIAECEAIPCVVYIPYIVLVELDRGSTAAPVNQLLSRFMRQKNTKLLAQNAKNHDQVFLAKATTPTNDDLIMGAALQLKEAGKSVIMLSNDHNLIAKCCANDLKSMTSFDLVAFAPDIIATVASFIETDLFILCPKRETIFGFMMELLASAIKAHLVSIGVKCKLSSTADKLKYELMNAAASAKIADVTTINKANEIMRECRKKRHHVLMEDLRRFMKYACAILEQIENKHEVTANTLTVCRSIYFALKSLPESTPVLETQDYSQRKNEDKIVGRLKKRDHHLSNVSSKSKLIKKDISRKMKRTNISASELLASPSPSSSSSSRHLTEPTNSVGSLFAKSKSLSSLTSPVEDNSIGEMNDMNIIQSTNVPNSPEKLPQGRVEHIEAASLSTINMNINSPCILKRCNDENKMEVEEQQGESISDNQSMEPRNSAFNIENNAVYMTLNSTWQHLNNVAGSWASHCDVHYAYEFHKLTSSVTYDHVHLNRWFELLTRLNHFYERLTKLNSTVAKNIQLEVAENFLKKLNEVWTLSKLSPPRKVRPVDVLNLFGDHGKRDLLLGGLEQLKTFRKTISTCNRKLLAKLVKKSKKSSNQ